MPCQFPCPAALREGRAGEGLRAGAAQDKWRSLVSAVMGNKDTRRVALKDEWKQKIRTIVEHAPARRSSGATAAAAHAAAAAAAMHVQQQAASAPAPDPTPGHQARPDRQHCSRSHRCWSGIVLSRNRLIGPLSGALAFVLERPQQTIRGEWWAALTWVVGGAGGDAGAAAGAAGWPPVDDHGAGTAAGARADGALRGAAGHAAGRKHEPRSAARPWPAPGLSACALQGPAVLLAGSQGSRRAGAADSSRSPMHREARTCPRRNIFVQKLCFSQLPRVPEECPECIECCSALLPVTWAKGGASLQVFPRILTLSR